MNAAHSPAPWTWEQDANCEPEYGCLWDANQRKVIDLACNECGGGKVERAEDRALLGAAPELLSALVGMFDLHEPEGRFQPSHYKTPLFKARKAIAKAMGVKESEVTETLAARWQKAQP